MIMYSANLSHIKIFIGSIGKPRPGLSVVTTGATVLCVTEPFCFMSLRSSDLTSCWTVFTSYTIYLVCCTFNLCCVCISPVDVSIVCIDFCQISIFLIPCHMVIKSSYSFQDQDV